MFAAYITNTSTSTESHYRPKKNQTMLMTRPVDLDDEGDDNDADNRATKLKLPGLIIPYLTTQKGIIISKY